MPFILGLVASLLLVWYGEAASMLAACIEVLRKKVVYSIEVVTGNLIESLT